MSGFGGLCLSLQRSRPLRRGKQNGGGVGSVEL